MKIRFDLTTAALLASRTGLALTSKTAPVSQQNDAGLDYTQARPTHQAAGIVGRGHATWPPSPKLPRQQPETGTACDVTHIRIATERIQKLLSDFRNVSSVAIGQLESMESLLKDMGDTDDDPINISSLRASSYREHTSTSVAAGSMSNGPVNMPDLYSNYSSATRSQPSSTPTTNSGKVSSGGGDSVPITSSLITAIRETSQPVRVIPITTGANRGSLTTVVGHDGISSGAATAPATQSEALGKPIIPSSTIDGSGSVMRSTSTVTIVPSGAETGLKDITSVASLSSPTAVTSGSSSRASSEHVGGTLVTTEVVATNNMPVSTMSSSNVLASTQTVSGSTAEATKGFMGPGISTATVSGSGHTGSPGAVGGTRSATGAIIASSSIVPSLVTQSPVAGTGASASATDRGVDGSEKAGSQVGSTIDSHKGHDHEYSLVICRRIELTRVLDCRNADFRFPIYYALPLILTRKRPQRIRKHSYLPAGLPHWKLPRDESRNTFDGGCWCDRDIAKPDVEVWLFHDLYFDQQRQQPLFGSGFEVAPCILIT
ncbi:hypothetical protein PG991_007235 [Apiospora marii]|uniref:Uncharacterized protein n=1 Tax=Apiospora marii TaxID=335849 RepID=A0ABR1RSW4_9PEZI